MRTVLGNTLTKGRLKFRKYDESFKFMFYEGKILVMVCYSFDSFPRLYRMSVSADNWYHRYNRRSQYVILHHCNLVSLRIKRGLHYPL